MPEKSLTFKCPQCGLTTAGYGPEAPLCLLCAIRKEERDRCAKIVQRLLNACDHYEPRTDTEALQEALEEIEADGK